MEFLFFLGKPSRNFFYEEKKDDKKLRFKLTQSNLIPKLPYLILHHCSCLAGESVHFYDEVHELAKIPVDDPVRRIYMARHIIEKYVIAGMNVLYMKIFHKS